MPTLRRIKLSQFFAFFILKVNKTEKKQKTIKIQLKCSVEFKQSLCARSINEKKNILNFTHILDIERSQKITMDTNIMYIVRDHFESEALFSALTNLFLKSCSQ